MVALIPGLGRFPGGGPGNPLQYSCLENPMDRGVWQVPVRGVTESDMTEKLSLSHFLSFSQTANISSGCPGGLHDGEYACNAGYPGLIPG